MQIKNSNNNCSICLGSIGEKNVFITECNHTFCGTCMLKQARNSNLCPLCRTELIEKEPTNVLESIEDILTSFNRPITLSQMNDTPQSEPEITIDGVPEATAIGGVPGIESIMTGLLNPINNLPEIESIMTGLLNPINNLPEITQTVSIAQELPIAMRTRSRRRIDVTDTMRTRSRRRIDVTERNDTVNNSVNTNTMFSDMVMSQSLNLLTNINNNPEMRNEFNTLISGIGNSLIGGDINNFSEQLINTNLFSNITS